MNVLKYPIILLAICFGLGIIIQHFASFSITSLVFTCAIFLSLFLVLYFKYKNRNLKTLLFGIITYLLTLSVGMLSFYIHQEVNQENHYSHLKSKQTDQINGIVIEELKPNASYTKFIVEIDSFNHQKSSGKILVYFSKKNKDTLQIGNLIALQSHTKPLPKSFNPNSFDYSNYMKNQNVFHQTKCFEHDYFISGTVKNFNYYINHFRQKLVHSFENHGFSPKTKSIIQALLLGQKQQIDRETLTDYKNAGVVHILAISGLHIGIIYLFLNFALGFLNRFKHGKTFKLILIIVFLWFFALISGMSASITRAVTMFSVIALGNFLNRRNSVFNAVAASFLILLIYNPLHIFDVGFQLSYAAVISILLFQPFYKKFYFSKNKIIVYVTDLFLVSITAQIGVLPLMMLYFKQVPTLFLLANLVVIPIATAILMLGIIVLCLNFVAMPLSLLIGKIISFLVELMNNYIHWLSSFKNYVIKDIAFTSWLTLTLYFIIASVIYWIYKPRSKHLLYVLSLIISFQFLYFYTKKGALIKEELIIFNTKETTISIFNNSTINVFSNDSLIHQNQNINDYKTSKFNSTLSFEPIGNTLFFNTKKIILIDEDGIYNTSIKPDIVVIRQNSRINIERLILTTKPEIIVADRSNSFTSISRWKAICLKYKIPFHAIAEKGFYKL